MLAVSVQAAHAQALRKYIGFPRRDMKMRISVSESEREGRYAFGVRSQAINSGLLSSVSTTVEVCEELPVKSPHPVQHH